MPSKASSIQTLVQGPLPSLNLAVESRTCPFSRDYHANAIGASTESPPPPPFCLLSLTSSSPVFPTAALLSRSFPTPEGFVLSTFI
ncbi:uncharacterized protein N7525_001931 [Penicillium rubens]|uniref:uncharacterized protein n=1 Tax=Penicillium rubens TaxID=1108849 RepID=UPI002A5AA2AB|nr:uncharacterized protein N7525_001931 [Penicillium rubens]KAJ5844190.1 hypothetical protein N7525_001931 [Penicillium rubens]KAJ5845223.1 hypothetical protein N7534_008892 [Penicillium rubens]